MAMESTEGTSLKSMIKLEATAALTASCKAGAVECVMGPVTLRICALAFAPARPVIWKVRVDMGECLAQSHFPSSEVIYTGLYP